MTSSSPPPAPSADGPRRGADRLDDVQLGAYFALIEASSLLRHAVEQQLLAAGSLSYVQFQLLATLGDSPAGSLRMTDLADGVVYSRSGLTYQAQVLEKRGLITRAPAADDERSTTATITEQGRAVLEEVFPGHVAVLDDLFLAPLSTTEVSQLADVLGRVRDHLRSAPPRSALQRRARRSTGPDLDPGPDPAAGSVRGGQTVR